MPPAAVARIPQVQESIQNEAVLTFCSAGGLETTVGNTVNAIKPASTALATVSIFDFLFKLIFLSRGG